MTISSAAIDRIARSPRRQVFVGDLLRSHRADRARAAAASKALILATLIFLILAVTR